MTDNICTTGHAILGGCGHLGSRIALGLLERGCGVVIIDRDIDNTVTNRLQKAGCSVIKGDICDEDILDQAGIASAGCYLSITGDDHANLEAAISARQKNPDCTVVTRLYDQSLGERIEKVFNIRALSAASLASPAFVSAATDDTIISALTVDGCCLSVHSSSTFHELNGCYIGKSEKGLRLCADKTEDECFYASVHSSRRHFFSKNHHKKIEKRHRPSLIAGFSLSKLTHEIVEIWKHSPAITKHLMTALLIVSAVSIIVFCTVGHMSPLDAIYFVVTTMTTVGYGDINLQYAPFGLKIFGILMMLSGAALLATVYAIIADRVLAARVEYLLGRRRVNLFGHTIVVGLGKVGYRVARDLKNLGLDIVGIETDGDSENVNAAKALFPVIVGDAARTSILHKAAIDTADTLLALTDDSLLNLSVALNTLEHNPNIRAIVRTYDTGLAEKFVSFGLEKAISTSAIAAPVFVDAAIYPNVQGSFRFNALDIMVARYIIDADSDLFGKTPIQISDEYGLAIVATTNNMHSDYDVVKNDRPLYEGQKVLGLLARK